MNKVHPEAPEDCSQAVGPQMPRRLYTDLLLEDVDLALSERRGSKASTFTWTGEDGEVERLSRSGGTSSLDFITEQLMTTYGLEFLDILSDVVVQGVMDQGLDLPTMLEQTSGLPSEGKLIIWVDDDTRTPSSSTTTRQTLSHLLITSLLELGIEPEVVISPHDLDEEVLLTLVNTVSSEEDGGVSAKRAKETSISLLKIGLNLVLASTETTIVVVDSATHFLEDDPDFLDRLLGGGNGDGGDKKRNKHKVIFLRNSLNVKDKGALVQKSVDKITNWLEKEVNEEATAIIPVQKMPSTSQAINQTTTAQQKSLKDLIEEDLNYVM